MKIKKHIKAKRQYVSPSIYVKVLQMEGLLGTLTGQVTGGGMPSGDGTGGGGNGSGNERAKRSYFLEDDEIE